MVYGQPRLSRVSTPVVGFVPDAVSQSNLQHKKDPTDKMCVRGRKGCKERVTLLQGAIV
jgi:precorrin isomerase